MTSGGSKSLVGTGANTQKPTNPSNEKGTLWPKLYDRKGTSPVQPASYFSSLEFVGIRKRKLT